MKICARHGVHTPIEKPIADTVETALRIDRLSKETGTRVLVGYHRRHNPLVWKAREIIRGVDIGRLVALSLLWALLNPVDYYNTEWRTKRPGGGPLLINIVHDLDTPRYICGEINQVYAHDSSMMRGFDVEDSISVSLTFKNGAVSAIIASDATEGPWSYESTKQENSYFIMQPKTVTISLVKKDHSLSLKWKSGNMLIRDYVGGSIL